MANDILDFIMDYEEGKLTAEEQVVDGFQLLIDTGLAWQLQGHYGRMAQSLIDAGLCHWPRTNEDRR